MTARWGRASQRPSDLPDLRILEAFLLGAAVPVIVLIVVAYALEWA